MNNWPFLSVRHCETEAHDGRESQSATFLFVLSPRNQNSPVSLNTPTSQRKKDNRNAALKRNVEISMPSLQQKEEKKKYLLSFLKNTHLQKTISRMRDKGLHFVRANLVS